MMRDSGGSHASQILSPLPGPDPPPAYPQMYVSKRAGMGLKRPIGAKAARAGIKTSLLTSPGPSGP